MTGEDEFQHTSVDDILDGKAPSEPVFEADKATEPEPAEPPKGEEEGATPAPETEAEAEPEQQPAKPEVDVKGIIDERRKRQAAEQELAELRKRVEGLEGRPQPQRSAQPQQQRPDPYEDPEGARRWDQQQADDRDWNTRVAMSESFLIEIKGEADYREKEDAFLEAAERNPALYTALRQSPNPALFAYKQGANHLAMKEIGPDPAKYREKLEAEIREKLKAEMSATQQPAATAPAAPAKPQVPKTLAAVQSAGPRGGTSETFDGPTPLNKLIG